MLSIISSGTLLNNVFGVVIFCGSYSLILYSSSISDGSLPA